MAELTLIPIAEQVASHLRQELFRGRWVGTMPGRPELAAELGVNHKTVECALRQLEAEGLLIGQGPGRRRRIELPRGRNPLASLRVAILTGMPGDRRTDYIIELQHRLTETGHQAFYTARSMHELGMEVRRIGGLAERTVADAWVVVSGSREVLEWFAARKIPAFALFGRRAGVRLAGAGPDKAPAYAAAARTLLDLGHRRIVLLALARRRHPGPGRSERAFLAELAGRGLPAPTAYHLPEWEENVEGFQARLRSLFQTTPPTALIVDTVSLFSAAQQFVAREGLRVPEDVSLICTDESNVFRWCRPSISHIRWDWHPVVRRAVNWAAAVSRGKTDRRQSLSTAEFVPGGTIGPVAK